MTPENSPHDPQQQRPAAELEATGAAIPGVEQAQGMMSQTARLTETALAAANSAARAAPAEASDSDITDELEHGGPAFGSFVKSVGLAVAEAQQELDKSMVAAAKELSEAKIDVIAIFEQVVNDDDGTMAQGNVIMQQLPLINYVMPTVYKWSRVYLEADMSVSEFNSANGFNIQKTKFGIDSSAQFGIGTGFGVSGNANFDYLNASTSTSTSVDKAAGSMHMEATLEPRDDIELPRPFVIQKGPRLRLSVTASADITETGSDGAPVTVGRDATITAELTKTDGSLYTESKLLQVSVDRNDLTFTVPALSQTDPSTSQMSIKIERRAGAAFDPATPRTPALVRVSFGVVNQTLGISI